VRWNGECSFRILLKLVENCLTKCVDKYAIGIVSRVDSFHLRCFCGAFITFLIYIALYFSGGSVTDSISDISVETNSTVTIPDYAMRYLDYMDEIEGSTSGEVKKTVEDFKLEE